MLLLYQLPKPSQYSEQEFTLAQLLSWQLPVINWETIWTIWYIFWLLILEQNNDRDKDMWLSLSHVFCRNRLDNICFFTCHLHTKPDPEFPKQVYTSRDALPVQTDLYQKCLKKQVILFPLLHNTNCFCCAITKIHQLHSSCVCDKLPPYHVCCPLKGLVVLSTSD